MRTRAEVGELVARLFDRLDNEHEGKAHVVDALLLVEIEVEGTEGSFAVLRESTSGRGTVDRGIMQFTDQFLFEEDYDDE